MKKMFIEKYHLGAEVNKSPSKRSRRGAASSIWSSILACASLAAVSLANHQTSNSPAALDSSRWPLGEDSWNYWWSYSGVSGPSYWGLLNSDWFLCDKGKRQSPINIDTSSLVYDPHLAPLVIGDNDLISGILYNDGHSIVFNGSTPAAALAAHKSQHPSNGDISSTSGSDKKASNKSTRAAVERSTNEQIGQNGGIISLDNFILDEPNTANGPRVQMLMRTDELKKEIAVNNEGAEEAKTPESFNEINQPVFPEEDLETGGIDSSRSIDFSGAGLAYSYKLELMQLRFGLQAGTGSEHQINKRPFAAELQLLAYNSHLYRNFQEASSRPYGLLAIAILIDTPATIPQATATNSNQKINDQLERLLIQATSSLGHRGRFAPVHALNLSAILPETDEFVTYEGSLTQPGCHESVTWVLLNRALYASKQSLDKLRSITADEQSAPSSSGTPLGGNTRPLQAINKRPIRTNIRPSARAATGTNQLGQATCPRLWTRYEYLQSSS